VPVRTDQRTGAEVEGSRRPEETGPPLLEIADLRVSVEGAPILKGIDLTVRSGEIHALMGPNGSGKSTLAKVLLGNPGYQITAGSIRLRGEDITAWPPDVRGKAGLFLAFQEPETIAGVPVIQFLRQALSARRGMDMSALEIRLMMVEWMEKLGMDPAFGERHLNEGFSGGEKKRNEILQMALLEPEVAVLDETDSGLDVDALRTVARGINTVREARTDLGVLVISHYQRMLDELAADRVHVLVDGVIVARGGPELVTTLESEGYDAWRR
jgi:Fe-S cluster assembly ATP-binding protein